MPATAASRRARAWETQNGVAAYLRVNGWPFAESAGAGRAGVDVTGTPGLAVEVKARRDLNLTDWLRQAVAQANGGVPVVIHRPDGYGLKSIDAWPVTMRLADFIALAHAAGYGTPPEDTQ